jgi:pilus assembly protein FimV
MQWKSREMLPASGLLLAAALTLFPVVGHALGLGKLKVLSALNEPLNAEVEFTSITEKELKGLNTGLAPRVDFDTAGVERAPYLSQIKFTVSKRLDGTYYLQLRTEQPMEEPFLHLLLQVEWPGGRLVHEYTALIDPPYRIAGKPAAIEAPRTSAPAPTPALPVPTPQVAVAPPAEAKPPEPAPEEPKPKVDEAAVTAATVPAEAAPKDVPAPEAVAATEKPVEEKLLGPSDTSVSATASAPPPEAEPAPKIEPLAAMPREDAVVQPDQTTPAPVPETAVAAAEEPSTPTAPQAASVSASAPEYAVQKGDTLWQIASKVRGDKQISVEQVILALYRTNKDAFFGNNVNNLKSGKILKLPESETIGSVSVPEARKEFRAQYDAWQEYKLKLAGSSRAIKLTETDASALAAAETEAARLAAAEKTSALPQDKAKETAKPEKKAVLMDKGKQDELLKIVRSTLQSEKGAPDKKVAETESAKDAGTKERQALADRAATLEESLESKRLENKELSEKIGMVRSQLKKESRLIELESQSLAQAQKKPAEIKAAEPVAKLVPAPAPVAKPVEQPKATEPVPEKAATPPAPAPAKAPEIVKKSVPPPAPSKEEKGFLAGLLEAVQSDLLMPLLIGVVVLLSGGIALVYFRRRQKSIAEFEESILSADAISGDQPVTTSDTTGHPPAAAASGDTSFLSDFSQGGMGNIHTDEVDPIAEADVYLAYGRDETAEEILKEAVVKHPERHELKLKLLEIYHTRNDVAAFETMAEELYAAQGGRSSKVWDKVEEMGRKLNPDNPMFKGGAPKTGGSAPKAAPAAAQNLAPPRAPAPAMDEVADSIDFDLGTPVPAPAAPERGLDFDLGESKPAASDGIDFAGTMKMESAAAEEKSDFEAMDLGAPADNSLDFDIGGKIEMPDEINMDEPIPPNEIKWEPTLKPSAAPAELSLETAGATAGGAQSAQWDETATKLDLAKAYIDMGDAEGARSILQEVISEGNDAQKKQAQELSAQIA